MSGFDMKVHYDEPLEVSSIVCSCASFTSLPRFSFFLNIILILH